MGSGPYVWLRPDFVAPSPLLVIKDKEDKTPRILVKPHLIDAEFCKAWMPYFCRSGHLVVKVDQFLGFVEGSLVRISLRWLRLRSLRRVVWMGGPGVR